MAFEPIDWDDPKPVKRYLLYCGDVYYSSSGGDGDLIGSGDAVQDCLDNVPEEFWDRQTFMWYSVHDHTTMMDITPKPRLQIKPGTEDAVIASFSTGGDSGQG